MMKTLASLILALAILAGAAAAAPVPAPIATPTATPVPTPTPLPLTTPTAAPTVAATLASPAATPPSNLVSYTGQLLDYRKNYVYFTSGDAFGAVDEPRIIDYFSNQPVVIMPQAKMFARATFDPTTKKIIELAITTKRLKTTDESNVHGYVIVGSTPAPAPEIQGQALTGKQVAVSFEVTVPPTTSFTDNIYISTDSSGWNATAIKLDRVDAYKYRALRYFASGTRFAYRVTRGSWNSVERGEDNLDSPPHQFFVREVDSLVASVTVYHWSDERGNSQGAGPLAIPTPYNPSPFGGGPGGIAVPQIKIPPTPLPGH